MEEDILKDNRDKKDIIIHELYLKHGINKTIIKEVAEYPLRFVINTMRKGDYENVRVKYYGMFAVKPNKVKYYKEKKENKNDNNTGDGKTRFPSRRAKPV